MARANESPVPNPPSRGALPVRPASSEATKATVAPEAGSVTSKLPAAAPAVQCPST